eukprot:886295-Prymnesium_polylepis.1
MAFCLGRPHADHPSTPDARPDRSRHSRSRRPPIVECHDTRRLPSVMPRLSAHSSSQSAPKPWGSGWAHRSRERGRKESDRCGATGVCDMASLIECLAARCRASSALLRFARPVGLAQPKMQQATYARLRHAPHPMRALLSSGFVAARILPTSNQLDGASTRSRPCRDSSRFGRARPTGPAAAALPRVAASLATQRGSPVRSVSLEAWRPSTLCSKWVAASQPIQHPCRHAVMGSLAASRMTAMRDAFGSRPCAARGACTLRSPAHRAAVAGDCYPVHQAAAPSRSAGL